MKTILTLLTICICGLAMGQSFKDVKQPSNLSLVVGHYWCYEHGECHRNHESFNFNPIGTGYVGPTKTKQRPVPDTIKVRVLIDDGRAYPTQVNAWLFYQEKNVKSFTEIDAIYLEADKKKRITSHVWLFWVFEWRK